jgi:hypothetical protein
MNNMNIENFNNKQFDIFGTIFTIKLVDTLDADDNLLHYGITEGNTKEIRISKEVIKAKQPDSEVYVTLVHEIVHAVLDTGQYLEESQKEPLVEWLTRCIISLLKQDILCK